MELVEVRLPTSKKETPKDWFKNLLGAFDCLESLWSKKCGGCKEVKTLKKFSKGGQSDGRSFSCKELDWFDLTDREQFLTASHHTNLQPLWWRDNITKGTKEY
jgi:hypothetical protein